MRSAGGVDKIILGDEYDEPLRDVVLEVLREMGARPTSRAWGVGGSQELETRSFELSERVIVVEAETYVGLTISGDSILMHGISGRVRTRLPTLESRGDKHDD